MPTCHICLNSGRSVKYVTKRIQICQWCVTLLSNTPINLEDNKKHLLNILLKQESDIAPPQPISETHLMEQAKRFAVRAGGDESLIKKIFSSILKSSEIKAKTDEFYEILHKDAVSSYEKKMSEYNTAKEKEIPDRYRKLLSGEYNPKRLNSIPVKRQTFHDPHELPTKTFYEDVLTPADKKILKYIRAHERNLMSGMPKEKRLSEEHMQNLREFIKKEDGFKCMICGQSQCELQVHHIIPIEQYGSNHLNNLVTLCYSCHNKQHLGFTVSRHIPVRRQRTGGEFTAIDIETTGLSNRDEIIEIAAVKFKGGEIVDQYSSLVNPGIPIPYKITEITGINNQMVFNVPNIDTVFDKFILFIDDSKLVCHNASFDMRFLNDHGEVIGYEIENEIIDTLPLSRKKLPHLHNHKLSTLIKYFNINTTGSHRALDDSIAAGKLYIELLRTKKR